jgi:glycosyltransferase involved in cell wall biosynthesis
MKLLIVTQYYWPESFLINGLSQKLCDLGHQVTVITGKPNYPEGNVFPGYTVAGIDHEEYGGIEVIRIPLWPRKKGALGLVINYISFVLSGLWYMPKLIEGRQFDSILVFAISPITAVIPAISLKRKTGAHLVVWVQDLWPQSLSATGYVRSKLVLKLVGSMVSWIYAQTDTLLAQSHAFVREIGKLAKSDKIFFYPNSIESPILDPEARPGEDMSCFDSGFSVVFAGNIGKAQAIPTLIEAATLLSQSDCQLVLVGEGSMLDWAKHEVSELKLNNVHFIGRVESRCMPWVYKNSDALLVSLADKEIFSYTIPGKVQACFAAGKPIIASLNGEAAQVVQSSGAGLATAAEDAAELAKAILKIRKMSGADRKKMGMKGLKYFQDNFDINIQAQHLIEIIEQRIKSR